MKLEIRELDKRDYKKAIQFAVTGMHFDWYMDSKLLLKSKVRTRNTVLFGNRFT